MFFYVSHGESAMVFKFAGRTPDQLSMKSPGCVIPVTPTNGIAMSGRDKMHKYADKTLN